MKCVQCSKPIDLDNAHKSRYHIHLRCLLKKCYECGEAPLKRGYFVGKNRIYCRDCYDKLEAKLEQRTGDESV